MKLSVLFIINPISGTAGKEDLPAEIMRYIDKDKFDIDIIFTDHAGHAKSLAQEAASRGINIVVAVGGDGTVNEVASALVHTQTALGIVPCGSGNGLARHLLIPLKIKQSIEIINRHLIRELDYGVINEHPFFCTCNWKKNWLHLSIRTMRCAFPLALRSTLALSHLWLVVAITLYATIETMPPSLMDDD